MLIGITGKARSGKDQFAEYLAEELFNVVKAKFVLMAYAHELKLRVQKDFDLSHEQLWGDKKEIDDKRYEKAWDTPWGTENGPEPVIYWTSREILQAYGQFFRTINYNFWVEHLFRVIEEKDYKNVIVTDVRHSNEADPIIERGGYMIRVVSEREDKESIHGENHISETAMDTYNNLTFEVDNSSDLKALKESAKSVVKFLINLEKTKK